MGVQEILTDTVRILVPPKTNDLDDQQRWRWVVFAAIIGLAVSLATHIALACGYIPGIFPGFATTADMQMIQRQVSLIATLNLEREMRTKAGLLCIEKNSIMRQELNDDISKLQNEYREIKKDWYRIPRCDQL